MLQTILLSQQHFTDLLELFNSKFLFISVVCILIDFLKEVYLNLGVIFYSFSKTILRYRKRTCDEKETLTMINKMVESDKMLRVCLFLRVQDPRAYIIFNYNIVLCHIDYDVTFIYISIQSKLFVFWIFRTSNLWTRDTLVSSLLTISFISIMICLSAFIGN